MGKLQIFSYYVSFEIFDLLIFLHEKIYNLPGFRTVMAKGYYSQIILKSFLALVMCF